MTPAETAASNLPLILTVDEAARIARVANSTMYQLIHMQGFPVVRLGRAIRIPTAAFLKWLESQAAEQ